jgi:hypothetical protein
MLGFVFVLGGVHTRWGARTCVGGHVHALGGTYMSGHVGGRHARGRTRRVIVTCNHVL